MSNCILCGSLTTPLFDAGGYYFRECTSSVCKHVFVSNPPDAGELDEIYASEDYARAHSGGRQLFEDFKVVPNRVRLGFKGRIRDLESMGCEFSGASILEIGSSSGVFLQILKERGAAVAGMELSRELSSLALESFGVENFSGDKATQSGETFDFLLAYAVLEHLADPKEALTQWRSYLVPGGHILIDVPNYRSLYRAISRRKWIWLIPPFHLQYFCPESLKKLLLDCGYVDVRVRTKMRSSRLFIFVHHLYSAFGRSLEVASYQGSLLKYGLIRGAELFLRLMLFPLELALQVTGRGHRVIAHARRPETADLSASGPSAHRAAKASNGEI